MKTGIFGGTFNPVHFGHLRAVEEAREILGLDRIIFIPCYLPPHKGSEDVAPPEKRVKMLELALKGNPSFEISDMELKRGGKSYSVETLDELRDLYGEEEDLFFIIGADSFVEIGTWRKYPKLFDMTNFVVLARPGYMDNLADKTPKELLPVDIRSDFCYDSQSNLLKHKSGRITRFLETTLRDISSSAIREKVSKGLSVRHLVPDEIQSFILEEGLYS